MTKQITYEELENTLQQMGAQISAAETHGLLTGMVCLTNNSKDSVWHAALLECLDCKKPTEKQWKMFEKIVTNLRNNFAKLNFDFDILLPNENAGLKERVNALGLWCRGYLSGLGLVGITSEDLNNEIVKELVDDLSKIAHVSMGKKATDKDEDNFIEIVEYVRIAVQNIQLELQNSDKQQILH